MKILLVQPNSATIRGLPQLPLALMYVGGYAEKFGHDVKIVDRNIETNTIKVINSFRPDLLGITSLTGKMILDGINVSRYIKERYPKTKVVWGGIHASVLPRSTLKNDFIDYVVIGEGEETFAELLDALQNNGDLKNIPQLGYKENGEIMLTIKRAQFKNMDNLPLAAWHLIEPRAYLKYETLFITSRGCPHRCAFCYTEQYNFRQWRAMSAERVGAEIKHAEKYHPIRRFRFDDDNFCVDKKRACAILDLLPKDIPLYFECRVDYINEEFCRRLSVFKDPFLFLGVESGSDDMLKKMQKDFTTAHIRNAFTLLNKYRIKTSASFIIGSPGETIEQVNETMRLIDEIKPTRPSCCIYASFPGTKFTLEVIQKGKMSSDMSLFEWGEYSDGEQAKGVQLSEVDNKTLNRLYKLFWWKFVLSFILNFRFKWVIIGVENYAKMKLRCFLRVINQDFS